MIKTRQCILNKDIKITKNSMEWHNLQIKLKGQEYLAFTSQSTNVDIMKYKEHSLTINKKKT